MLKLKILYNLLLLCALLIPSAVMVFIVKSSNKKIYYKTSNLLYKFRLLKIKKINEPGSAKKKNFECFELSVLGVFCASIIK
jgi:hypothetical protein